MQHFQKKKKVDPSTATPCTKITSKLMVWCISVWKPYWTEFSLIAFILLFILFRCPIRLMPISLSSLSPSPVTLSKLLMLAAWNTSEYLSMLMQWSHSSTDWNSGWGFTSNLEHKFWASVIGNRCYKILHNIRTTLQSRKGSNNNV